MTESETHEWAAGVHAALFSLGVIIAAVIWRDPLALALILTSQALAYLGRDAGVYLARSLILRPDHILAAVRCAIDISSVGIAIASAVVVLWGAT